ncbi:ribonuclease P protein subunit p38 isoform X3 [Numida meleagris]|uniref:ribonuclease P protein subunit p38 isoform X3 n=1 Tax=Numida meleagris TaxID=8996 RepID=UPI000B3E0B75|nr:ribonuclease P protein subunit p38 isoform X3 [Numida meleagris]
MPSGERPPLGAPLPSRGGEVPSPLPRAAGAPTVETLRAGWDEPWAAELVGGSPARGTGWAVRPRPTETDCTGAVTWQPRLCKPDGERHGSPSSQLLGTAGFSRRPPSAARQRYSETRAQYRAERQHSHRETPTAQFTVISLARKLAGGSHEAFGNRSFRMELGGETEQNLGTPIIPQGTASLRKAKKTTVKTCLDNPFVIQWKTIDGDSMHFILQTLEEKIKCIGLKKIETPRKKKRSATKKQMESKCDASNNELPAEEETEGHRQAPGWTDVGIRRQLAIGINEVTKALEKNELLLLLVCKSAKPAMITSHLIQLSASRATPAGQVPRLSETVAPLLGLTSILALGFKRQSDKFTDVIEAITPKIPALEVPWFQYLTEGSAACAESSETDEPEQLAETLEEELSRQKRKRTESNQLDLSHVILQPLKIKKVVPNPNKIKKPPRKKKKAFSA